MKPIINPQTLTEEQREIIKEEYGYNTERAEEERTDILNSVFFSARIQILNWLFGKEFFEK